jgi:hypothetical protein
MVASSESTDLPFVDARCRGRLKVLKQPLVSWPFVASHSNGRDADDAAAGIGEGSVLRISGEYGGLLTACLGTFGGGT